MSDFYKGPFAIKLETESTSKSGSIACSLQLTTKGQPTIGMQVVALTTFSLLLNKDWVNQAATEIRRAQSVHEDLNLPQSLDVTELTQSHSEYIQHAFRKDLSQPERISIMRWHLALLNKLLQEKKVKCSIFTRDQNFNARCEMEAKSFLFGLPYTIDQTEGDMPFDAVLVELVERGGGVLTECSKNALQYMKCGSSIYKITNSVPFFSDMVQDVQRIPKNQQESRWLLKGDLARPIELTATTSKGYPYALQESRSVETKHYAQFTVQHLQTCSTNRGDSGCGIYIIGEETNPKADPPKVNNLEIVAVLTHTLSSKHGVDNHDLSRVQPISRIIYWFEKLYEDELETLTVNHTNEAYYDQEALAGTGINNMNELPIEHLVLEIGNDN